MNVIRSPRHKLHRCREPGCFICEGGLAACVVCGGGEATLPTDCPGRRMTCEQVNLVQTGTLDYRYREGWIAIKKRPLSRA